MAEPASRSDGETPRPPRATYRLQFHHDFALRSAIGLVPYLAGLGISHLYASPLFKACPGSTHGYDVCDHGELNPELGTPEDLRDLVAELRRHGMGLVMDIVPNHMGIGTADNRWWWDVLTHGPGSRFARHFDIDWQSSDPGLAGKVMLPFLGEELDVVLQRGELVLEMHDGVPVLRYFESRYPVDPATLPADERERAARVEEIRADPEALRDLVARQHYLLSFWRHGDAGINYRRFFTITTLAGVRVEDPRVFADVHALCLEWCSGGLVDGLRIDHPDGLRDPAAYLARLRHAAPAAWIVVEKILEPGEDLPADWPIAGTTGYDFLNRVAGLFVDSHAEKSFSDLYAEFTGEPTDVAALILEKKRLVLRELLVAEVRRLTGLLCRIAGNAGRCRHLTPDELREAIIELAAAFPVYRTYVHAEGGMVGDSDSRIVRDATAAAQRLRPDLDSAAFELLDDVLLLRLRGESESDFVMRFQQLAGPAMAKGVEDTTFYCYNRFVALNEVGGHPGHFGLSVDAFHSANQHQMERWPDSQLATATHDTKRGEDVRSRLHVLAEIPDEWRLAVLRWREANAQHKVVAGGVAMPSSNDEYLLYQTLVGAWPESGTSGEDWAAFADRVAAYMLKAVKEAKVHTTWTAVNEAYESALGDFVARILTATPDNHFLKDLESFQRRIAFFGRLNSLAQTLLKVTSPGVPDFYQGTELWDLSLVDPDNRRPVDFDVRRESLAAVRELLDASAVDRCDEMRRALVSSDAARVKLLVIVAALSLRRRSPDLFARGNYVPLSVAGSRARHVIAFARSHGGQSAIVVAPRFACQLAGEREQLPLGSKTWGDTVVTIPGGIAGVEYRDVFTDARHQAKPEGGPTTLRVAEICDRFPLALLESPA